MLKRVQFPAVLAAFCGAWIAACSSDPGGPADEADLRVLHATPALGPIDVEVAGVTVLHAVAYGTASSIVRVPSGQQRIVIRSGGQVLGQLDPTLTRQHVNSVIVANGTPLLLDVVTPDTGQPASNRANIRMVNVVGPNLQPPTLLQVLAKAPDIQNPDSVMKFGLDATVASYGTLMYFNPGHFEFKYVPAGTTTVLTQVAFDVAAGEKKAVVLERAADGSYRVQVVIEQ